MPTGIYQHKKGYKRPPFTKEWKGKMSSSQKGKPNNFAGKKHTEETKEKNRLAHLGKIPWIKGKKHSAETIKKMSGANCHFWKGGITPINKQIRNSEEYKLWRTSIFIRDKKTCIWCGSKKEIQADHIKPFALYPELRFAIDNGRTLCHECHKKTDTYGWKLLNTPEIKAKIRGEAPKIEPSGRMY